MSDGRIPTILIDSTVFSNYAYTDNVNMIIDLFEDPATTQEVIVELENGVADGHDFLENALQYLRPSDEPISSVSSYPIRSGSRVSDMNTIDFEPPYDRISELDVGEASLLKRVIIGHRFDHSEWSAIATDDQDARNVAKDIGIPVTGSIGILARGLSTGEISIDTADDWLNTWVEENGYRSPIESLSDL